MKKSVVSILGVLAIAALTIQIAAAAPRGARKAQVPAPPTHQLRNAFGSVSKAVGSKSCDILWCYQN
jgi:hypothetical protein